MVLVLPSGKSDPAWAPYSPHPAPVNRARPLAALRLLTMSLMLTLSAAPRSAFANVEPADETAPVRLDRNLHVLLVGVSKYPTPEYSDLPGVEKDLRELARVFRETHRCSDRPGVSCRLEVEENPRNLNETVRRFVETASSAARVIVYYAGHGRRKDDRKAELIAGDGRTLSVEHLQNKTLGRLNRWFLVMDACFVETPGAFDGGYGRRVSELVGKPARQSLSSTSRSQAAADDSDFRRAFVAALEGAGDANHDGYITASEIARFVRRDLQRLGSRQVPQFRRGQGTDGDFVLWLPAEGAPAVVLATNRNPVPERAPDCMRGCPRLVELRCGYIPEGEQSLCSRERGRRGFFVSKFEITFSEWDVCYHEGHCAHWANDHGWGRGRQPVVDVSFEDAKSYTVWLKERTGQAYRLLTTEEWMLAARAGRDREHWWGRNIRAPNGEALANCWSCGSRWDGSRPAPVGMFPPSPYGLHDFMGNVWEWTCLTPTCEEPVLKGGSFATRARLVRVSSGSTQPATTRRKNIGFRVMRAIGQER